jgi:hypothetical protein
MNRVAAALLLLAAPVGAGLVACSTTVETTTLAAAAADGGETGVDPTADAGTGVDASDAATDASRPPVPALPVIPNQGGPVIAAPEIVTVTWQGDTLATGLEAFDAWMVKSAFWKTMMAEWGVGPGTYVGAYHVPTAAPATLDDAGVQKLLSDGFAAGTIPRPNGSRIYTIYPPAGTTVTSFGSEGCSGFQAYHYSFAVPASAAGPATTALYAVAPRCADSQGMTPLDFITWGQSHEVMETASDPIESNPAWRIDVQSLATPQQGENADLCTGHPTRVDGFMVTRNWSNVAAKAGQRPCVPAAPGPMFGVYAVPGEITLTPGTTTKVKVQAYATGAIAPFAVQAFAADPGLTATLDKSKAADGDELTLTLTPSASWVETTGQNLVYLQAQSNGYTTKRHLIVHAK